MRSSSFMASLSGIACRSAHAVRSNVFASVNQLRHGSAVLEQLIEKGKLIVVGAEYSLETGEVTFFDF